MAKEARLVALFAVLTLSHQQLVQAAPDDGKIWLTNTYPRTPRIASRPQTWINGLEKGFKFVQFGDDNFNLGGKFTLDHMVSWNAIVDVIGMELDKWQNMSAASGPPRSLTQFVDDIFAIDRQAYVNEEFCTNARLPPQLPQPDCYYGTHQDIIRNQTSGLNNINNNQTSEARTAIQNIQNNMPVTRATNGAHVRRLLKALHNAPANLRYGDSRTNFSVGETMDPMGTDYQIPTDLEQRFQERLTLTYGLEGWAAKVNCVRGRLCIKSSTGIYSVNINNRNVWAIIEY